MTRLSSEIIYEYSKTQSNLLLPSGRNNRLLPRPLCNLTRRLLYQPVCQLLPLHNQRRLSIRNISIRHALKRSYAPLALVHIQKQEHTYHLQPNPA